MRRRFAQPATRGASELWIMTPGQVERLATAASETKVAIQGLLFASAGPRSTRKASSTAKQRPT
jgi:hypothetical protein